MPSPHPRASPSATGGRLFEGELFAASSRIDGQVWRRRTFGVDALACPRCEGKVRVLATLIEPDVVRKILLHLGLRASPLPRAPARDPTDAQTSFDFDAA